MGDQVEEIRKAAALIRQRAEAAQRLAPLPWRQIITDSETPSGVGICEEHRQSEPMWPCENCWAIETFSSNVAEHIASWHPLVALAVADWLDGVAHAIGTGDPEDLLGFGEPTAAFAVVRAYLGEADRG